MRFRDPAVQGIDLSQADGIRRLIAEYLCAGRPDQPLDPFQRESIEALWRRARDPGLIYEQFNELLLVLDQDRISRPFFEFFFGDGPATAQSIREGIETFRGFAMLCFGGFRRAFSQLSNISSKQDLARRLSPFSNDPKMLEGTMKKRPNKSVRIVGIDRDDAWYVGELTTTRINKERRDVLDLPPVYVPVATRV